MYLLDTNILIYAVDSGEPERMSRANNLLSHLILHRKAAISTQVLSEFANVALKRLRSAMSIAEIYTQIERYEKTLRVMPVTFSIVLEAIRGVRDYQLAFYDAQIWAAARMNQFTYVLSEDFNTGSTLDGVTFLNPLEEHFEWSQL